MIRVLHPSTSAVVGCVFHVSLLVCFRLLFFHSNSNWIVCNFPSEKPERNINRNGQRIDQRNANTWNMEIFFSWSRQIDSNSKSNTKLTTKAHSVCTLYSIEIKCDEEIRNASRCYLMCSHTPFTAERWNIESGAHHQTEKIYWTCCSY